MMDLIITVKLMPTMVVIMMTETIMTTSGDDDDVKMKRVMHGGINVSTSIMYIIY